MKLDDDDFSLLGLKPQFAIDRAALDEQWRRLQAQVHPDRHAAQGSAAQRVAMQWAVRVNEAYQRLKNPLTRGAYLCELRGAPVQAENNTAMPAAFLMQQMAWRESLEEASSLDAVTALDAEVQRQEQAWLEQLRVQLDEQSNAPAAAQTVRGLLFVVRLRQDIERRLEALEA